MTKPLSGVRILDLTNVLAGPYCCYQLALMGADVIKVERPDGGDLARVLGADPTRNADGMGISFLAQNAQKRSITLNLKSTKGVDLLKRLVRSTDVLVENFRPGVMERLGLGYEVLTQENSNLIYAAISGFGQTGPRKDDPAYDQIVQGISGVMSITGKPDDGPNRVGYPLADTVGGMTAAFAISAALNASPRGGFLDISMTEAVLSTMGWVVSNHLIGDVDPVANGNENPTSAPSGTFQTADMPINIAANRDEQWVALARLLDRDDLRTDARFASREDRKRNRHALRGELESVLGKRNADHWVAALNKIGVPAGPVMTVSDALKTPQIQGRNLTTSVMTNGESIELVGSPIVIDGQRNAPQSPPPLLGIDNDSVWAELGLTLAEIADLKKDGVL